MVGLFLSSKLDWGSYIISTAPNWIQENWCLDSFYEGFCSMKVSEVALYLHKSTLYGLAWNTVIMSGMVLLAAFWKC